MKYVDKIKNWWRDRGKVAYYISYWRFMPPNGWAHGYQFYSKIKKVTDVASLNALEAELKKNYLERNGEELKDFVMLSINRL
jgi:hypothetical protein